MRRISSTGGIPAPWRSAQGATSDAYHDGSNLATDNALIRSVLSARLEAFGRKGVQGPIDAAAYMDLRRLPELFCGFRAQRSIADGALP